MLKTKNNSGFAPLIIIFIVLAVVIGGGAYYFGKQNRPALVATPSPTAAAVLLPTSLPSSVPISTPASGWKTYANDQYGFEISYPATYQVLTDKENLYGWPKAVVLLYNGGQSYDLVIEVWDSQAEYQAKYQNALYPPVVKKLGDKYLTLLNQNNDAEVAAIIATFKP